MNVVLLTRTPDAEKLIYSAFRQCYSKQFAGDIFDKEVDSNEVDSFIKDILLSGHDSPIEHVSFSFAIEGVSRALTHQLVRHRIASYSQQSQRYCDSKGFEYVIPPSIANNPEARLLFQEFMESAAATYGRLQVLLGNKKTANEDARFVLPNAAASKIVVTMNCRSLLHFFSLRCCSRAQWEIRDMAGRMLDICKAEVPVIFEKAGAACEKHSVCFETDKFACGMHPSIYALIGR